MTDNEKWSYLIEKLKELGYDPADVARGLSSFESSNAEYAGAGSYKLHRELEKDLSELANELQ